jgi:signal transduction histidine kinase
MTALLLALAGWLATTAWGWQARRRDGARLARACHEVRNPLCAAQLALEGLPGARPGAAVLEIRRAAAVLEELAAPPARGRPPLGGSAAVDVAALARQAAAGWEAVARRHGAELALALPAGPLLAPAEPVRVAQALGNLVANAAEHGGGEVRVTAAAVGEAIRVEVTDGGAGLPAPVPVLAAAARHRRGRRGHGLAVAEAAARACGGRLSSAPSARGARLVLELPAAAPASRAATRWAA